MDAYENGLKEMETLFTKDCQFALATAQDNVPSVRYVDAYWDGASFYVVTYGKSRKALEIVENPNVALCNSRAFAFSGKAYNVGHPLRPENLAVREKLTEAFKAWYFLHNNENDEAMCYLRVAVENGFFHRDGTGYQMDFVNRRAKTFPFSFNTVVAEE